MSKEKQPKDPAEQGKEIKTAADLIQDEHNYRKHSDTNKARIRKSIDEAGLGRSVVIDADGVLVAGNGVQSVIDKDTPVRVIETDGTELVVVKRTDLHTGDPRRKTLALADNATSDDVEWDFEAIAEDWDADSAGEWGVEWPTDEEEIEQKEAQEDDFDPDKPVDTVCKKGDIWKLGNHRLMCGDSTDSASVALLMDGEKADMCFTDPPYGVSYEGGLNDVKRKQIKNDALRGDSLYNFLVPVFENIKAFTIQKAAIYIFYAHCSTLQFINALYDAKLKQRSILIWKKIGGGFGDFMAQYMNAYEPCIYASNGESVNWYGPTNEKTVWEMEKEHVCDLHPTMKPIPLVGRAISNSSKEGDIVIDLFGGSGTTMIACEQLGRKCRMMEIDPHYCDVIIARWENLTGKNAEKLK